MSSELKYIFITRLGIGVYDLEWWRLRQQLFEAFTFPSVSRFFARRNVVRYLLIDSDIPVEVYERLWGLADTLPPGSIRFSFVQVPGQVQSAMQMAIKGYCSPDERVAVIPIDDDDAVGADFLDNADMAISSHRSEPCVISFSRGIAIDAPNARCAELIYESKTGSTILFGRFDEVANIVTLPHQD